MLVAAPVLLALDLFVFPRGKEDIPPRAALMWSMLWTIVGLSFALLVWEESSEAYAIKYVSGFVVEKALTIDQVLVFAVVISTFRAPPVARQRTVFFALWIGLLLKVPFIGLGTLLARHGPGDLRWVLGVAFLAGGVAFGRQRDKPPTIDENRYLRFVARHVDFVERWEGNRYWIRENGRRLYTLAFAMLMVLLTADIYFAATVPFAFAVQKPGFLVLASSTLAIVGIRSLYWWVTSLDVDPVKLKISLGAVLWLVGLELMLEVFLHEPTWVLPVLLIAPLAWPLLSARKGRNAVAVESGDE
jgi:tellurite resistance protein TerC